MYRILACLTVVAWVAIPAEADAQQSQTRSVTVDGQRISVQVRPLTRDPGLSREELADVARKSLPANRVAAEPLPSPNDPPR